MLMFWDDFIPCPKAVFNLTFVLVWVNCLDPAAEIHIAVVQLAPCGLTGCRSGLSPLLSILLAQITMRLPDALDQGTHLAEN